MMRKKKVKVERLNDAEGERLKYVAERLDAMVVKRLDDTIAERLDDMTIEKLNDIVAERFDDIEVERLVGSRKAR